ncbi:MAG: hypothetical protein ABFE13_03435 [Phycisphaerales bacterium]
MDGKRIRSALGVLLLLSWQSCPGASGGDLRDGTTKLVLHAAPQDVDEEPSDLYGMGEADRIRPRQALRRANRHLIAVEYLEALRRHATTAGQWPDVLDELKPVLPNDPVTQRPFDYRRLTKTQAILEGPMPEGGSAKDWIRYELNLRPKER